MMRRVPRDRAVRTPDGDADMLRTAASAANEAVDAVTLQPPARTAQALSQVAHRYARVLDAGVRDLQEALQAARTALRTGQRVAVVAAQEAASSGDAASIESASRG